MINYSYKYSIVSNSDIKNSISKLYNIDNIKKVKLIREGFNDNYLIKTKNKKYILRVYINNKSYIESYQDFQAELDFISYLGNHNFSVPVPIKNKYEKTLSESQFNSRRYMVLFPFIEGEHVSKNMKKELANKLGRLIAKLHLQANEFQSSNTRHTINLNYILSEPLNYYKKKGYDLSFYESRLNYCKEIISKIKKTKETFGMIHGDVNPSNILYSEKKGLTLLDFDYCGLGYRIHDLAVPYQNFSSKIFKNILEGYKSEIEINQLEEKAIKPYLDLINLRRLYDVLILHEITKIERGIEQIKEKDIIEKELKKLKDGKILGSN